MNGAEDFILFDIYFIIICSNLKDWSRSYQINRACLLNKILDDSNLGGTLGKQLVNGEVLAVRELFAHSLEGGLAAGHLKEVEFFTTKSQVALLEGELLSHERLCSLFSVLRPAVPLRLLPLRQTEG